MKNKSFNCMIAGVGGQGTVLSSKLIAAAAIKAGFNVRTTETIGMAQRGGSVFGHVRIGAGGMDIFSPLIPLGKADIIIAFEPAEAVRQLPYLCKDGMVISCDTAIKPIANLQSKQKNYEASEMINYLNKYAPHLILLDGKRLTAQNAKTLNVALLGAAAQYTAKYPAQNGTFPFDANTLNSVLVETLPKRFLEMNIKAFELGRELCP